MKRVISEQHSAMLADLDRLIANVSKSDLSEGATLLHMARLDLHTRIYRISEGELRELSSAVEHALFPRGAVPKRSKRAYPRRRCERPAAPPSVGKSNAGN